jgi:hypothetical protein
MQNRNFLPFYERIANCVPGYVAGRVAFSAFLGFAFLGTHQLIDHWLVGKPRVNDWSWFLAFLISTAMLCLYYATHTLGTVCQEFDTRFSTKEIETYRLPLINTLSDRNFARAGICFGLLNCLVGYSLGLPYLEGPARVTIVIGYFVAGFVCGMSVWGIYGVLKMINAVSGTAKDSFDFTSPDHCGGTGFLGDALVIFSSVTLIVGIFISIYILKTDWGRPPTWAGNTLKGFWIFFPYGCWLVALFGPAIPIAKELRQYKLEQEGKFQKRLSEIRRRLEGQVGAVERKDLREDYAFQQDRRKDLHAMRTWPFGLGANLKYLTVFAANVSVHISSGAADWLTHSLHKFVTGPRP